MSAERRTVAATEQAVAAAGIKITPAGKDRWRRRLDAARMAPEVVAAARRELDQADSDITDADAA